MDKRFLSILVGIVVVLVGIFAFTQHSSNKGNSSGGTPTNHISGQDQKHVTLMEYGDYECPVCGAYYQPLKTAVAQYSQDIYFQFRNLPLTSIHPNAFAAARAAEAAGLQNKYWQMHDALYDNQDPSGGSGWVADRGDVLNDYFVKFAQQIGISNIAKFKTDYASDQVNGYITADLNAFAKTGQEQATPTFFLDGKYLSNNQLVDSNNLPSAAKIGAAIQAEINKKNQ